MIETKIGLFQQNPFDQVVLHLDRAMHRIDHAVEFDDAAVAGALDDAAVTRGDGRID